MKNSIIVEAKRNLVKEIVKSLNGKTFSVTFERKKPKVNKETGEKEFYATFESCRTGVKKHLKGGKSTIAHCEDLVGVYIFGRNEKGHFEEKGYRSFSADLVTSIKFSDNGKTKEYTFEV